MSPERFDNLNAEIEASLDGISNLQDLDPERETASVPSKSSNDRIHRGTVVGLSGKDVIVELGPRMQGVVNLSEFEEPPKVGDIFDFTLRGRAEDELWLLSRRDATELAGWDELHVGSVVKAKVTGQNTGGLELKIGPGNAFMPASHVALGHVEDLSTFLGENMLCQVLEIDPGRKRVVISRRAVLESERAQARADVVAEITSGQLVKGKVTRIEPFGAFVEITGGVEGLVHVSNLSRKRVEKIDEFLTVGQDVQALVLEIKDGGRRIGLGMKQLEPDPWDEANYTFREDTVVDGTVVRLMEFGAFVELAPGIEGLLHVSQIARDRVRRIQDALTVGEALTVRILSVDASARRISLSRLDSSGAILGSEEAGDMDLAREMMSKPTEGSLGTNLGSLFKKALEKGDDSGS